MTSWKFAAAILAAVFLAAGPASATDWSDGTSPWLFRLRGLAVVPNASANVDQIPGANAAIDNSYVPELDINYFWNANISTELILGVTPHHVTGRGALNGVDIGRAWLLPPTLTLKYHVTEFGAFRPYVGAGVNYTMFLDERAAGGTINTINIHDTFGAALQAGFDYMFDKNWGFNIDVKRLFLRPVVDYNGGSLTGRLTIDPWLVGAGVVYRF